MFKVLNHVQKNVKNISHRDPPKKIVYNNFLFKIHRQKTKKNLTLILVCDLKVLKPQISLLQL